MRLLSESLRQVVLNEIQSGFPLACDPYRVLAERLGLTRMQVMRAIASLREDGTIRRIGASFSSAHLGYVSTLCALAMWGDEDEIDDAAGKISAHPEVTHNYLRDDRYNIWFTVIAPSWDEVGRILGEVCAETGCNDVLNLPATTLYKINVDFSSGRSLQRKEAEGVDPTLVKPFSANDPFDRALVNWASGDIVGEDPFSLPGFDEARVINRLREWRCDGTIRRFGAFVRHRGMGFAFNGMTVWDVPPDEVERLGQGFAAFDFVSHCYERPRAQTWPFNLYAMVHAKTQDQLDSYIDEMRALGRYDCRVLVSSKEYKKTSPIYFS